MEEQLNNLGIPYVWQVAVDGRTYEPSSDEYDVDYIRRENEKTLTPGELGCALSHRLILERIVKEKISYTLVLEDDVLLPENFKSVIEKEIIKNNKRTRWDYLLFDYPPVGYVFLVLWFSGVKRRYKLSLTLRDKVFFIAFHSLKFCYILPIALFEKIREILMTLRPGQVRFYRPVYFAGAYLITLAGAQKLLPLATPIRYTADRLPNVARLKNNLIFRCFSPRIVVQKRQQFGSSILNMTGAEVRKLYPMME